MAEYKNLQELRNYPLSNGETADLFRLISADRPSGWVRAEGLADLPVGTVAYVSAMGKMRRGVVVKVGRTKASVAITTQGAVDEARRAHEITGRPMTIRVQIVAAEPETVFIVPRPEPVQEAEEELVPLTVDVEGLTTQLQDEAAAELAEDEASLTAQAQTDQVEAWLARHREAGTPRTQWSPVEDARLADHAEALREEEDRQIDGRSIIPGVDYSDQEEASSALQTQRMGRVLRRPELTFELPPVSAGRELIRVADLLTLHSQAGKVDNMNNDANTKPITPTDYANQMAKQITSALTAPAQSHTGSTVVSLLERVWNRIREDHTELPEVVITTGSGEGVKWGHFRPESWKVRAEEGAAVSEGPGRRHELFLSSEALAKGAHQVLQTMLHEAAHTLSRTRGIKDTSRQGRWHNGEFKKAAAEMGLEHKGTTADKSHGFSFVTLTPATKDRYADLLAELDREIRLTGLLPAWLGGTGDEDERGGEKITGKPTKGGSEGGSKSGNVKATCVCVEPIIVRISRKVMELGVVRCDACSALFLDRS